MTSDSRQRLFARVALATGVLLLLVAVHYTDWTLIAAKGPRLIVAALAAIAISGVWHLARTFAWSCCFPPSAHIRFARLFRVRLAAEAVSYVTVRGVAGEPLKVVLLGREADARTATAAVALERIAYVVFTTVIVAIGALIARLTLPLSAVWQRIFLGFAVGSIVMTAAVAILVLRRRPSASAVPTRTPSTSTLAKARRFVAAAAARAVILLRDDPQRVAVLAAVSVVNYASMALEAWAVFWIAGAPISLTQALAIETFTRVASFVTAVIPGNLGGLEAASLAAATAVGSPAGSVLALARRVRGLFWAAAGFAIFPHRLTPAALSRDGAHDHTHDAYLADAPLRS